jgi:hypothetical protein
MTYDAGYLGSNLNKRSQKAAEDFDAAVAQIRAKAAQAGALGGSRTYLQFIDAGLAILVREVNDAIQFAYNLTGEHDGEVVNQVAYCATQMAAKIMQIARERASNDGVAGGTAAEIINKMDTELFDRKDALLDDFKHGMMGSQRLKKDPVVSIVSNQTNSPGAVQQIGVGNFSQSAFVQNHKPLVEAIDAALSSAEFKALPELEQQGFRDVADVVKEEADKTTPDPGKLKRWGKRLVELGTDLGLKVATGTIATLLAKMFTGAG